MTLIMLPERGDGVRLLCASGELDVAAVPAMLPGVPDLVAAARGVVLDLSDVTFFDSSGVRLLDRIAGECQRAAASFRVVAPPGSAPRRVLELVGLDALVADNLAAAVGAVQAVQE